MSKRPHPDANDIVARARAAIAEKYAKLSTEHKSPKGTSSVATPQTTSPSVRPNVKAASSPSVGGFGINPDLQRRLEEAKARAAAKAAAAAAAAATTDQADRVQKESRMDPGQSQNQQFDPRGGLGIGLHPALQGELLLANKKNSQRSKFATTIANRKPDAPKVIAKSKQLELLKGPDEGFTDREKNPYFDHKLGGRDTTRPVERKSKALQFSQPGKYINQANQIRAEENLKALQARIAASARRAGLEDEFEISARSLAKEEPPEIEWWDAPYTTNGSYDDIVRRALRIVDAESPITSLVQHPIPIPAPADLNAPSASALMYTKKEHKKIRNQERAARQKDKQDKQRLGLMPPDAPKVKLSNMATVLAHSTVQDPTKVEQEVRAQVQARKDRHEQMNEERKLSHEEKREKAAQKLLEDESRNGIRAAAWRVEILANAYHRRRIDENAQQAGLSGVVILHPRFNLVYAEGGAKSIKFFKKLMETRIEWQEGPRSSTSSNPSSFPTAEDHHEAGQDSERSPDFSENRCTCVWEGELRRRAFSAFRFKKCELEGDVREALRAETYHLWNVAKGARED